MTELRGSGDNSIDGLQQQQQQQRQQQQQQQRSSQPQGKRPQDLTHADMQQGSEADNPRGCSS